MLRFIRQLLPALLVGLVPVYQLTAQSFTISIGVRETGSVAALGGDGGTTNGIEWINLDAQTLTLDGTWQQFTFNFGTATVTAFAGATANGVLDGTRGTLEHIRIVNSGGVADPVILNIDDIVNNVGGVDNIISGFESTDPFPPVGVTFEHMFQEPGFSGSTASNLQTGFGFNSSTVVDTEAHSGTQSDQVRMAFVDGLPSRWLRLTTFSGLGQPNPTIDFTKTGTPSILSFWMRGIIAPPAQRWINPGSGNWDDTANWGTGVVPNGSLSTANFLSDITGNATVTLNNPITVNTIRLNSTFTYTIDGGPNPNTLTLNNVSEAPRTINAELGNHVINAPIQVNFNTGTSAILNFTVVRAQDLLTVSGPITLNNTILGGTLTIQKNGDGKLDVSKLVTDNAVDQPTTLRVNAGSLRFIANTGASRVSALSIAGGVTPTAQLDLRNNSMVIDYFTGTTSPQATVLAQLASGFNAGAWTGNGIVSSTATTAQGIGYAESLVLLGAGGGTFEGLAVDDSALILKLTYRGDANLDGQVDITDLAALATSWQTAGAWGNGDFDYSGFVDITDLAALATNWQAGVGVPTVMTFEQAMASVGLGRIDIPEPASIALIGLVSLAALRRRG